MDSTDQIIKKHGGFFAFSTSQFNEQKTEGVNYAAVVHGMLAPKENIKQLLIELENNFDLIISADLKKNGVKRIIHRELANHEAQITMDISDTVDALSDYKINKAQILAEFSEFMANCVKNDLF